MPIYDVDCHSCKRSFDDVFSSIKEFEANGGVACPHCAEITDRSRSWKHVAIPKEMSPFAVEGVDGQFTHWKDAEKAATAAGVRIMSKDEKDTQLDHARGVAQRYAETLGFRGKQDYIHQRKTRGGEMVDEAREKYVARQVAKHGTDTRAALDLRGPAWKSNETQEKT
jgi:DNA-directed RNA polymerase subunit RPC12/RpoP